MKHAVITVLTASLVSTMVGMPSTAQSQTVIIIGNGYSQPYYPQPYAYRGYYPAYGYYPSYYNYPNYGYGYYRPYGYGYYWPYRRWGYRWW
jgi:hypothetical protein